VIQIRIGLVIDLRYLMWLLGHMHIRFLLLYLHDL
jgi:hypothetical protein